MLVGSFLLNILLCTGLSLVDFSALAEFESPLTEKTFAGNSKSTNKLAIIRVDGAIMESALGYVHRQIDQAGRDPNVQGVVVRIDSPGGSITASDDLLHRLQQLRTGTLPRYPGRPRPMLVSMGAVAASGGYYIAMAAERNDDDPVRIFAERSTITGSIGVYASLPNLKEMSDKIGFKMELIRAGDIKASGSPFHVLTPQERQPWQDMVDHAFRQFVGVVETGRPALKGKLTEPLFDARPVARFDDKGNVVEAKAGEYTRRRADGGIFTADEALKYGLVDKIGFLDDAVVELVRQINLGDFRAVTYDRPVSLSSMLLGVNAATSPTVLESMPKVDATPKLWYLLPHAELGARLQP
jgi:protease-4